MSQRLLQALQAAPEGRLSGEKLAQAWGVSRAAVHKQVARLRLQGYPISATPQGYGLTQPVDFFDASSWPLVQRRLLVHQPVLPSTQDDAKNRARAGAPSGTLVVADRQTSGRGRRGRTWESPLGGLWFSMILRPSLRPENVPALILVAALDWVRTIQKITGLPAQVKWPNDVWVLGQKVAGLLTDLSADMDRVEWLVLGVGVNVNNTPPTGTRVPAASLHSLTGKRVDRGALLQHWLRHFQKNLQRFEKQGFQVFREDFQKHHGLSGKVVTLDSVPPVRGTVQGVDNEGRLTVRTPNGKTIHFNGGEVSLKWGRLLG